MKRTSALLMIALVAAACAAPSRNQPPQQTQFAQAVAPPERLRPADSLPEAARDNLRVRMTFHARDMNALVSDIMLLRYGEIRDRAKRIASDASVSRPAAADDLVQDTWEVAMSKGRPSGVPSVRGSRA